MDGWSGMALPRRRLPLLTATVLALVPPAALVALAAPHQIPAPYGLFVHSDCELKSEYSAGTKSTTVQLALTPPGPDGSPSAASLVLRAEYAGTQPEAPPADISIMALPAVTSNPTVLRGVQLELVIERTGARPVTFSYFGKSWGEYGFVPPGGEITRVVFSLSVAELKALLVADRITGRVMNSGFTLTGKELAALRQFADAIGIKTQETTPPKPPRCLSG